MFLHKLYVFQFIDNGDKNNFIKLLQSEACNIYQDLYACFDVTDHYFELLALNKPDSVHI